MGYFMNNLEKGINEKDRIGRDLTYFLKDENVASLNNFIRYGSYEHGRSHKLSKNKSIAEILLLTDNQITTLINFIEICRINKDLINGKKLIDKDDLFNKFLISIQNAPNNLPMYYTENNLNEEIFYYGLIKDLFKWIVRYMEFCKNNGFNLLYTVGIQDVAVFNGKLAEVAEIMSNYISKIELLYPHDELIKQKEKEDDMDRDKLVSDIRDIIKEELGHDKHHRPHKPSCDDEKKPPRRKVTHFKNDYSFRESGFNVPTLVKSDHMIYCNESIAELLERMDDEDILYLPKTKADTSGVFTLSNMKNIKIVGDSNEINATFKFDNTSCEIQNLNFTRLTEEQTICLDCAGETILKIEDCVFKGFDTAINAANYDSFSETELEVIDCTFFDEKVNACYLDSVVKAMFVGCNFINCSSEIEGLGVNAVYATHSNNNKTIISFFDCEFANCGTVDVEDSSAIRLINNKISSRVGIAACYIEECRFTANFIDLIVGKDGESITDVDIKMRNNIGLTNIVNLSEEIKEEEKPEEVLPPTTDEGDTPTTEDTITPLSFKKGVTRI